MDFTRRVSGITVRLEAGLRRYPITERHLEAVRRANALRYTRWAAGAALFGYLSLFPLAVLATLAFSAVLRNFPDARLAAEQALADALSVNGLLKSQETVNLKEVADATTSAGIIGVVGLLLAGLGWVDATIEGVRRMLGALRRPRPWLVLRLEDAAWLVALGAALLVALVAAVSVRSFGEWILLQMGWNLSNSLLVQFSGDMLALVMVWLVIASLYAFAWSRPRRSWQAVLRGSLLALLGMVGLTRLGYLIVGRTLDNPVYGTLAVAAALLVLLYTASAVVMYCACWIAVYEGAPESVEQSAYYGRLQSGGVELPVTTEEAPDALAGDGGVPESAK